MRLVPALPLLVLCLGCPAPSGGDDAGLDAGVLVTDGCLNAPAPPEPPRLPDWVCPADWDSVPAYDLLPEEVIAGASAPMKACAPPALPTSCPAGQRPALGSTTCQTVGDACPAGDWPPTPAGVVRFAKAGAVGGDGLTTATPFGSVAQALTATPSGGTVVIAKGTYTEYIPILKVVTLLGACAEQTIIVAPSRSSALGTVDINVAATLKNLQVRGPRPGIWVLNTFNPAVLQGVIVRNAELAGIFASDNGHVQLNDVLVQESLPDPADRTMGRALQVRSGGVVTGSGIAFEKNRDVAITLDGAGCTADLSDLIVRDTQSELASTAYGQGMEVRYGAHATVTRGLFERNRNMAIVGDQPGSTLTLNDVVLQDCLSQENNKQYGGGLDLKDGIVVTLNRTWIRRNRAGGMRLGNMTLSGTGVAVTQTAGREDTGAEGLGLVLAAATKVDLTQAVFADNHVLDILDADPGTQLTLTDVQLRHTRGSNIDGKWGSGFIVMSQAQLNATRLLVERVDDSGGMVQTKSLATLTDFTVRDTGFGGAMILGLGLSVQSGSQVTLLRASFKGNRVVGVAAFDESVLQLTDLRISDVGPDQQGWFGRAIVVQDGAIGSVLRGEFSRAREVTLYSSGPGTRLYVDQAAVYDTQPSLAQPQEGRAVSIERGSNATVSCLLASGNREVAANVNGEGSVLTLSRVHLEATTGVFNFGDGVAASEGATVVIEDSELSGNASLGVAFSHAQGSMTRTRVVSNAVGLYVGEGATLKEVEATVPTINPLEVQVDSTCTFVGNPTRVAATFLPVPASVQAAKPRPEF